MSDLVDRIQDLLAECEPVPGAFPACRCCSCDWHGLACAARGCDPSPWSRDDSWRPRAAASLGGSALTRHMVNARRRASRSGIQIAREHPSSVRNIDGAVAALLAWHARPTVWIGDPEASGTGRRSGP